MQLQARNDGREQAFLNISDAETAGNLRKRQWEQESQQQQRTQMAGYSSHMTPTVAQSGGQIPGPLWMVTNNPMTTTWASSQTMGAGGGDDSASVWTLPSMSMGNAAATMFRGSIPSGGGGSTSLHFMNFPTPMTLLPSQQLGLGSGSSEAHMGILAALNAYHHSSGSNTGASETNAAVTSTDGSQQPPHHGSNDRYDTSTSDS